VADNQQLPIRGSLMTAKSVSFNGVTKTYGVFTAVSDLSFAVAEGEIYGFLGPNGAGKTTALRMMLDIINPTSGKISILGSSSAISVRRRVGYLPEERGLYRKMRAADSIAYFAQLRGLSRAKAKAKAYELLERFDLGEFARTRNEALSKGMAQKVQLLSTIAHEPELLILDEPFSGLDPINQQTLEDLIQEQRRNGRTIIFSTHVMQHAERLCDRFLILANGKKRFEGTLSQARAKFQHRLRIQTAAPANIIEALEGVALARITNVENDNEEAIYEIELRDGVDPQEFLRRVINAGLALTRFEHTGATLHDIFVALASDGKTASTLETTSRLSTKAAAE